MSFWPDRARLAMSFVVNVEEGAEASVTDGDKGPEAVDELGISLRKPIRNLANESNYRYGLLAGAPRILDLLEANRIRATFTVAALALERAPDLARRIVAGGHEVCSHGWRWVHQYAMDAAEEGAFIAKAIASITATTGTPPVGWLSRYLFTANTRRLLAEAGFLYHMDDYSDDHPFWDTVETDVGRRAMLVLPYALDSNDMKLWTAPALTPAQWSDYAIDTFDVLYREGAHVPRMMSLGLHLRVIGRPGRIGALQRFIDHLRTHDDVWITTRRQIAEYWAREHPPPG